jgi:hypothetical protein
VSTPCTSDGPPAEQTLAEQRARYTLRLIDALEETLAAHAEITRQLELKQKALRKSIGNALLDTRRELDISTFEARALISPFGFRISADAYAQQEDNGVGEVKELRSLGEKFLERALK